MIRPLLSQKPQLEGMAGGAGDPFALGVDGATADPFLSLKDYTSTRQDDAAAILQEWLNEDRKAAVNE